MTSGTSVSAASRGINTLTDYDAYVVTDAAAAVPSTIVSYLGANRYSNFDTNGTSVTMYAWTPDPAEDAMTKVKTYAGRVGGGDLTDTFDNAVEDTNDAVIPALKAAVTNYTSTLVSVQGDAGTEETTPAPTPTTPPPSVGGAQRCTFTSAGGSNPIFTITGSVSNSKGTVTLDGVDDLWCLKMETATTTSFTLTVPMTVKLVFGGTTSASGKTAKIDGVVYTTSPEGSNYGIIQTLTASSHTISKGDSIHLFAILFE